MNTDGIVWSAAFLLKNCFDMKVELDRKDIIRLIRGFCFPSFDMAIRYMENLKQICERI